MFNLFRPVLFFSLSLLFIGSQCLHGQIRQWGGLSGQWNTDTNWSPADVPNSAAETAVLGGSGLYNVSFDASITIGDLDISNPNAVLTFNPDAVSNTLIVNDDFTNQGTINLNSDNTFLGAVLIANGTMTNAGSGTVNFGGTSTAASTLRRVGGSVVNHGAFNINQDGEFRQPGGTYTNFNTLNVASGKSLEVHLPTFHHNSGTVTNLGSMELFSSTLNFNGGSFAGNAVNLNSTTLNIGAAAVGAAKFNVYGFNPNTRISGNVSSAQTLTILPRSFGATAVHIDSDIVNSGTINLNTDLVHDVAIARSGVITNAASGTINFGGSSTDPASDRNWQADLTNHGSVNVLQNASIQRTGGTLTNHGAISVHTGKTLDIGMTNIHQLAGTISNNGSISSSSTTFNFDGGNITGNAIKLSSSTLNIGVGNTGSGSFDLDGFNAHTRISGDIAAAQTITVLPRNGGSTLVSAIADFTNNGSIHLNSDTGHSVTLKRTGTITNNGTISFGGASTSNVTNRILEAGLNNQSSGLVDVIAQGTGTRIGTAGANHVNSGRIVSHDSANVVTVTGSTMTNEVGGVLAGNGEFDFSVVAFTNNGTIAPGLSPGALTLDGDIAFGATSELEIELGGLVQGVSYDYLNVLDDLNLDGALSVRFIDGFESSVTDSDTFTIVSAGNLTGTFAGLADGDTLLTADGLGTFTISYTGNEITLGNFTSAIPEPSSFGLLLVVGAGLIGTRRRR